MIETTLENLKEFSRISILVIDEAKKFIEIILTIIIFRSKILK